MVDGREVCIVGAGVIGLTTATLLQEARPDLKVTIVADKFTDETLSHVAAGLFRPSPSNFCGPDEATSSRWLEESFAYYRRLLNSPEASTAGVMENYTVILSTEHQHIVRNRFLEATLPQYDFLSADQLARRPGGPWKHGCRFRTMVVECRRYLPYLMKKFESRGGRMVKRKISSLEELAGEFDAVVNCSGLGAMYLCGDHSITPIRGQVFKVKAPWITESLYADFDTYIIPGFDSVTLGGCRQFDSWNLDVSQHDAKAIWERCLKIIPSLSKAKVLHEFCGLRPYRPVVRVEKELLPTAEGGVLKVVHNYGHGGYGVTAAPGTSMDAVKFLLEMLTEQSLTSRLPSSKL